MGLCGSSQDLERKFEYLCKTPFFAHIEPEILRKMAAYFSLHHFKHGQMVQDEAFILVCEGELSISTIVPHDKDHKMTVTEHLARKKKGDFFSKASSPWTSSHKVTTMTGSNVMAMMDDTILLVLHQKQLKAFIDVSPETAPMIRSILTADVTDILKEIPFFKEVSAKELAVLAEICTFITEPTDTKIFLEGDDPEDGFYIVLHGTLKVLADANRRSDSVMHLDGKSSKSPNGTHRKLVTVAKLNQGDWFGEMALMVDMPRSATVVADSRVL